MLSTLHRTYRLFEIQLNFMLLLFPKLEWCKNKVMHLICNKWSYDDDRNKQLKHCISYICLLVLIWKKNHILFTFKRCLNQLTVYNVDLYIVKVWKIPLKLYYFFWNTLEISFVLLQTLKNNLTNSSKKINRRFIAIFFKDVNDNTDKPRSKQILTTPKDIFINSYK